MIELLPEVLLVYQGSYNGRALTCLLTKGGTRGGYPGWFRTHVLTTANIFGREAAADTHNVNGRSIVKWESRITPHRMTGGQEKSAQVGMD
eukprot:scaffold4562_cov145-Chaetoceros_neogracile.AAC.2